jgi:hypothetical protein
MSQQYVARTHYFDRQFLRPQDFADEQAYQIAMRRWHNIGQHEWGIVTGLELMTDADGGLHVQPGMAIDGYGRELLLQEQQPIGPQPFRERNVSQLDVWLVYDRTSAEKPPAGYVACGDTSDEAFYRYQEKPRIEFTLSPPDPSERIPREPESVPEGDFGFEPPRNPPDDPRNPWPVFLGMVRQVSNGSKPSSYQVDMSQRPYAGLVGESVYSPSGSSHIQLGPESDSDPQAFAISVRNPDPQSTDEELLALEVGPAGNIDLRGTTTLYGNMIMAGGAIEFQAGIARDPTGPPWRIYHIGPSGRQTASDLSASKNPAQPKQASLQAVTGRTGSTTAQSGQYAPAVQEPEQSTGYAGKSTQKVEEKAGDPAQQAALQPQASGSQQQSDSKASEPVWQEELRIEMARDESPGRRNKVVIGSWHKARDATGAEKENFQPCLTIADDRTVTVHGDLIVEGKFIRPSNAGRKDPSSSATPPGGGTGGATGGTVNQSKSVAGAAPQSAQNTIFLIPGEISEPARQSVFGSFFNSIIGSAGLLREGALAIGQEGSGLRSGQLIEQEAQSGPDIISLLVKQMEGDPALVAKFVTEIQAASSGLLASLAKALVPIKSAGRTPRTKG